MQMHLPLPQLTARDIEILRSVGRARYLTAAAIEWLHFVGATPWRDTHTAAIAAGQPMPGPSATVIRRLNHLARAGYLVRHQHATMAVRSSIMLPTAYGLTLAGWQLLDYGHRITHGLDASAQPKYEVYSPHRADPGDHGVKRTLTHDAQIGQLYAAIRSALVDQRSGVSIDDTWSCARMHSTQADHVGVDTRMVAVMPDATFALDGRRYIVEVESGSNKPADVTAKLAMYRSYARSTALYNRYGVRDITVLWIVSSPTRLQTLADRIRQDVLKALLINAAATPQEMRDNDELRASSYARHRIIPISRVHPITIQHAWQTPRPRHLADGYHLVDVPLW